MSYDAVVHVSNLVYMLEHRFKHVARTEEKEIILSLLELYYPIMQGGMNSPIEIKKSKMDLEVLQKSCLHKSITRKYEKHSKHVYICKDCGHTIYI